MAEQQPVVLIIDDDPINVDVIQEFLVDELVDLRLAYSGEEGLRLLEQTPEVDVVLLDRMMPDIDGMQILHLMKQDPRMKFIPVILETALATTDEVADGIRAGCFYYLTKPFSRKVLREVVTNAVRDRKYQKGLHDSLTAARDAMSRLQEARFCFRNRAEALQIAGMLANMAIKPASLHVGLFELMVNAVEHGNLGIGYDETTQLIAQGGYEAEVERRLRSPQYLSQQATITFRRSGHTLEFVIEDEGQGFDWESYLEMRPERINDNHGRGIALVNRLVFSKLEYRAPGNCVAATYHDK